MRTPDPSAATGGRRTRPPRRAATLLAAAVLLAPAGRVHAAQFCVHTSGELQAALDAAGDGGAANGQDNTVLLASGDFAASGARFSFLGTSGYALSIEGGYDGTCATQDTTPGASSLDGGGLSQVLSLQSSGALTVRHLTIRNGHYDGSAGGGAQVYLSDPGASLVFDADIVRDNVDGYGTGGLTVYGSGTVRIENSLFTGNSAPAAAALSTGMSAGSAVYLINDTIAGNTNTGDGNMITALGGASIDGHVSNTISWDNAGTGAYDFYLYGFETVEFVNDAYGAVVGTPLAGTGNFVGVDPLFAGNADFHLTSLSPVLRAGTALPAGGLTSTDLEGNTRQVGGRVDLGAFENVDFIFANGFDPF